MKEIMSREQIAFLNILKDFINQDKSVISDDLDWDTIYSYANRHQLSPVFYYQTNNVIFKSMFLKQLVKSVKRTTVIEELRKTLERTEFVFVKGASIAGLYNCSMLRTMGDVDVLIHSEDRMNVHNALLNAGFLFHGEFEGEWRYSKDLVLIEIHDSLVHRRPELEFLVDYFSRVWEFSRNGSMDWSFHLVYLLEHLRHHFIGAGVGFRQFMDIAIVSRVCSIDWDFVACELQKIGLREFASVVFSLIDKWFGISSGIEKKEISNSFFVDATLRIFNNGVFGLNKENKSTEIAAQMHYEGTNLITARFKYLLRCLFPRYEVLCHLGFCSYVIKSVSLVPVAWIHRLIHLVFSKQSRVLFKKQFSKNAINEHRELLKQWGLE